MVTLPIEWLTLNSVYTLTSAITAFRTSSADYKDDSGGPICELPEGAAVKVCGEGFNKRTVTVKYGEFYYHVYWRDLASAAPAADQDSAAAQPVGLLRLADKLKNPGQALTGKCQAGPVRTAPER